MAATSGVSAMLDLDISKFSGALNAATKKLAQFSKETKGKTKGAISTGDIIKGAAIGTLLADSFEFGLHALTQGVARIAGLAVHAFERVGEGLKNAFELGDHFDEVGAQIGETAGQAALLAQAFTNAGLGADSVVPSIQKMQKSLATGSADDMLQAMGLDANALRRGSPIGALKAIGAAIAGIQNPAASAAASMEIFGRSGAQLKSLFASGDFALAGAQLGKQVELLDKNAENLSKATDLLKSVGIKLQGFFVGAAANVAEALAPALDQFNKLDLTGIGQQFGEYLAEGVDAVRAFFQSFDFAQIGEIIKTALDYAWKESANTALRVVDGVAHALLQGFIEAVKFLFTALGELLKPDFWSGLANVFRRLVMQLMALMLEGVAKIADQVAKIPGFGKAGARAAVGARKAAADAGALAAGDYGKAGESLSAITDRLAEGAADGLTNVGRAFMDSMKKPGAFDTSGDRAALGRVGEKIAEGMAAATGARHAREGRKEGRADGGESFARGSGSIQNGAFAGAINMIMGRAANAGILEEAKRQTSLLQEIRNATREAAKTSANKNTPGREGELPGRFQ